VREIAWLFGFRDARVVLMEFISDGVDRFVGSEVQHQVFGQGSRAVLPALGQLLHLFAELGELFDRELRIVSLQDIDVAVGIDEFEDRLALGIDHPLRLFRHEDLGYWGVTEVFGPMWLARGLGLYSRESNLEVMKLQF